MDTFAAYQKSDEEALLRMVDDQDKQAVEEMVLSGKAIMLAKGTPVYMVNAAFLGDLDEVRVKGSSRPVWIMRECVTTPEGKVPTPEAAVPGDQF
jgi:hypothetical protein